MDPWWSFAVEAQAIDRVHRMGQLRDVAVTRFIVKDSIEGRMLQVGTENEYCRNPGTQGWRRWRRGGKEASCCSSEIAYRVQFAFME
jgi:hypothetical protein